MYELLDTNHLPQYIEVEPINEICILCPDMFKSFKLEVTFY